MNRSHDFRIVAAVVLAAAVAAGCSSQPTRPAAPAAASASTPAPRLPALPVTDTATLTALDRVLAGTHRSDANRARDVYRHPRETLKFFGIRQDQTVMEIWTGPGGWYTEILAPLLREHGRYIAANWDPKRDLKIVQDGNASFRAKLEGNGSLYDKVEVSALDAPGALTPAPPGSVDVVLSFRNLHNWLARDTATAMLRAMYIALKPGGVLGLVDHRADPAVAADPKALMGYVNEAYAIELAKSAGFVLVASSEINANAKDTRDHEQGVWSLPPTWRLGDKDRERYASIGESDRFTLKFVKPLSR